MWFSRVFERNRKSEKEGQQEPTVNQGIYYLYLIIIMQIAFVFGLMAIIMGIGTVLATPLWVFLFALGIGIWGCVYVYRKAKGQFQKFKETIKDVNLSDRNYEISFMGGVLTMRVEQAPPRPMLEAPTKSVIEAETVTVTSEASR